MEISISDLAPSVGVTSIDIDDVMTLVSNHVQTRDWMTKMGYPLLGDKMDHDLPCCTLLNNNRNTI
jgi:hypothetical protein